MKRSWMFLAVTAIALAITAPSLQAQGGPPQGQRGGGGARMMEMLFAGITLDAAQKTKIEAIQAKFQKEMPQMTPGERPGPEGMAKRRELLAKQQDEFRTVLTADQQKVYDKNLAAMRERMNRD